MNLRNKLKRSSTVRLTYIITALILIMFTIILTIACYFGVINHKINERRVEGTSLVVRLNSHLKTIFRDTIRQADIINKSDHEKVLALNEIIQPLFDEISDEYLNYEIGYYDLRLDSIVAINPDFKAEMLKRMPRSAPYFKSYESGKLELVENNNITITIPFGMDNRIIGFAWATTKTDDIYQSVFKYSIGLFGALIVFVLIPFFTTWFMVRRIKAQFIDFVESSLKDDIEPSDIAFLPELTPVLAAAKAHSQQLRTYEAIVRNSNDSITAIDLDYKITGINPAGEKLYGYTPEELLGQHITIFAVSEDNEVLIELLSKVKLGKEVLSHDMRRQSKDGKVIHVCLSMSPIRDKQGNITGIMSIEKDVTEKRQMTAEMQKLDGLNLIGQMAASITHEIRNPLTTIRGFLQLLESKSLHREYQNYFQLMIEELDRANSIITEFLSLSRNKPMTFSEQNLNTILNKLLPMLRADALKNETTIVAELEDIPNIELNEQEIRQVILNLARNSIESMPSGGVITIKTFLEDDQAVITVSDQGPGIPPQVLKNIGKPFLTTKEQGTGLGLPVSYNIVYRHRGTISVETGSEGTTFIIKLPLNQTLKKL